MPFYVPINSRGETWGVWEFDGAVAIRCGVDNPQGHAETHVIVQPGEALEDAMRREQRHWFNVAPPCTVQEMKLSPGEYYAQMARPFVDTPHPVAHMTILPDASDHLNFLSSAQGQLAVLVSGLQKICRVVHPCTENSAVYGHETRNLLILACTEVEMLWRSVLAANGIDGRLTTNTYVKLYDAMKLGEYTFSLSHYPWVGQVRPFENWLQGSGPTTGLPWYDAYNAVKHDRESNFGRATLECAIQALTAIAAMLVAIFGTNALRARIGDLESFFVQPESPQWHPTEMYINKYGRPLVPVRYAF